jgi:hypothetical protein
LLRDAITEIAGAQFGEGETAGGHDQCIAGDVSARGADEKFLRLGNIVHADSAADLGAGPAAFLHEHGNDFAGTAVAEELSELFLVPRDTVAFDQREKVGRLIPGQSRPAKFGIRGKVVVL